MAKLHSILGSVAHFKAILGSLWAKEYTPWVLAWILIVGLYFVVISKLTDYIVGGF